ncbi:hypothetical protein SEEH4630_19253, partial [Salmonella enterica subsp. enterica serovar Heidelberg str. N4630]
NVMIDAKKRHANSLTDWRAGQRDIQSVNDYGALTSATTASLG